MNPIRVLHVVGIMNIGGLETLIMNLYRNIDREKIQFDFLVHKEDIGAYEKEILELGGRVHRIKHVNKVGPIRYSKGLYEFFKKHSEYEIIHSHMNAMSGIILREAKKAGKPIRISHSHSSYPKMGIFEGIYKRYCKIFINKNTTHKFACSKLAGDWLYGSCNQVTILNNGIELDKFKYDISKNLKKRKELNVEADTFVVGHIGSFRLAKNHNFIIKVFNEIKKSCPNSILILVGDGELRDDIYKQANMFSLESSIKFLGIREDVYELLKMFDVLLFPSIYEGFPVTLIEAQASGLKCVVSDSITKEVNMDLNLIKFFSLDKSSQEWAKEIINIDKGYDRKLIKNELKDKGYDIKDIANFIENTYLNELKKEQN